MKWKNVKRLLGTVFLATAITGCSPQITTDTFTHEAGEELSTDVTEYATFKKPEKAAEATLDLSNVVADKVGTYEATITLKNKEYPFTVEVVDTTAPAGYQDTFITEAAKDEVITPDSYGVHLDDISDFEYGFRNYKIIKAEEGVGELIQKNLEKARNEGKSDVGVDELLEVSFNPETDTWDETGFDASILVNEIKPDKNGLYSLELVAVDAYGNADITKCYLLVDLSEPVFVRALDKEIEVSDDFEEYMKSATEGLLIKDNYLGNITDYAVVTNSEIVNSSTSAMEMKVSYEVADLVGNKATAERTLKLKSTFVTQDNVQQVSQQQEQTVSSYSNGLDRARAEETFALINQQRVEAGLNALVWDEGVYNIAAMRAEEVTSNFSHTRTATGRGTVEDYNLGENLSRVWGDFSPQAAVNGWMNSQTHKDNLLISYYTRTAVACYQDGKYCYYVQLFGY